MSQNLAQIVQKANAFFAQKKYKKAQKFYEQALKLSPENPTLNFNLGVALQVQGQEERAIEYYEKSGDTADAKNNLGIIFKSQNDVKKAQEYYNAALALNPNHEDAKANLEALKKEELNSSESPEALAKGDGDPPKLQRRGAKSSTTTQIPETIKTSIRESFTYKGLQKALNSKIITKEDIKAEAEQEQKNKNLIPSQRVHSVFLADLESGGVRLGFKTRPNPSPRSRPIPKANLLTKLQQKMGFDFAPGWKGIDDDGDLIKLTQITEDNWVHFSIEKADGAVDTLAYPLDKFLAELEQNPVYKLDDEEARDLAAKNLTQLDEQGRINLIQKIHQKTMAALQNIRVSQRLTTERLLKKDEDKKIEETLSKIRQS